MRGRPPNDLLVPEYCLRSRAGSWTQPGLFKAKSCRRKLNINSRAQRIFIEAKVAQCGLKRVNERPRFMVLVPAADCRLESASPSCPHERSARVEEVSVHIAKDSRAIIRASRVLRADSEHSHGRTRQPVELGRRCR